MSEEKENDVIRKLKQMPDIQDNKTKNELYKNISAHIQLETKTKKKKNRLFPLIAAISTLLLLTLVPIFLYNNSNQMSDSMVYTEESSSMDSGEDVSLSDSDEEASQESYDYAIEEEVNELDLPLNLILNSIDQGEKILHVSIFDKKSEYVIPLSLIVPDGEEMIYFYDDLEKYLIEFQRFGLDQVSVYPNNIENDLKGFIEVNDMDLQPASYLLFANRLFIKLSHDENSVISDAISTLKMDYPEMNISQTIPDNINFEIKEDGEILHLRLETGTDGISNEITTIMIESILLTAKSYGFTEVLFENMPLQFIGDYNLEDSIKVPIAVNPIFY